MPRTFDRCWRYFTPLASIHGTRGRSGEVAAANEDERVMVGRRNNNPRVSHKYAFNRKSSYAAMPPYVEGMNIIKAYQKMTNATGNNGEPFSRRATRQALNKTEKVRTAHNTRPPIPISTTIAPQPLSTPPTGGLV